MKLTVNIEDDAGRIYPDCGNDLNVIVRDENGKIVNSELRQAGLILADEGGSAKSLRSAEIDAYAIKGRIARRSRK